MATEYETIPDGSVRLAVFAGPIDAYTCGTCMRLVGLTVRVDSIEYSLFSPPIHPFCRHYWCLLNLIPVQVAQPSESLLAEEPDPEEQPPPEEAEVLAPLPLDAILLDPDALFARATSPEHAEETHDLFREDLDALITDSNRSYGTRALAALLLALILLTLERIHEAEDYYEIGQEYADQVDQDLYPALIPRLLKHRLSQWRKRHGRRRRHSLEIDGTEER